MQLIPHLLSLSLAFVLQASPPARISKVCFTRGEFIFVKDMKTGVEKRLLKGSYPSLSPDGNMLVFSYDNMDKPGGEMSREIKLLDLQTSKLTGFPSLGKYLCYGAIWSPDGKKIAFNIFKDKNWVVAIVDVESRNWRVLTDKFTKSVGVTLNSWTADSQSILCQDLDKIYQVGLNGDVRKTLATSDVVDDLSYISSSTTFSMSPDGRYLLFDTDNLPDDKRLPMVWIYDLQLRKRTRISPTRLAAFGPHWLGSNDEIVFTATPGVGRSTRPSIYRMRRDGTQLQLLVSNGEDVTVALEQ